MFFFISRIKRMAVFVRGIDSSLYGYCFNCNSRGVFIVGIDNDAYTGVYRSCGGHDCLQKAQNFMKQTSEELGYSKKKVKRERQENDEQDIPYMLEGWGNKRLEKLSKGKLVSLAIDRGIPKSGSKEELANNLIRWKDAGGFWKSKKTK